MDEIISGVQVIKMYSWERPFATLIAHARRLELKVVLKSAYVRAIYTACALFTTRAALFCTILSSILLYGTDSLSVAKVFRVAAFFNVISFAASEMFVRGVTEIAEAWVAFKRLQQFLDYEEKKDDAKGTGTNAKLELRQLAVLVEEVTAQWTPFVKLDGRKKEGKSDQIAYENPVELENGKVQAPTLQNINIEIPKGKLIGVVGPVGAGKSSLLQALLRELPLQSGSISINGSVSYACQEPWVFAGTVRQNILFGQEMDRSHYDAVVKSCDLTKDFDSFENGDSTMIGERGASLSGGQKARLK